MRTLISFLLRYHAFLIFLVLEVFCLWLIGENKQYQQSALINSSNLIVGRTYQSYSRILDYLELSKLNDSLAMENAMIRKELAGLRQNDTTPGLIGFPSPGLQLIEFIPARVINNSVHKSANYLTLNIGSKDGIRPGMGVIHRNGIVGIVKDVSEHFSSVISLLHREFRIRGKLLASGEHGSVQWTVGDHLHAKLEDIGYHIPVSIGDTVATTRYSSIFPENVPIGWVEHLHRNRGSNFYDITLRLTTNFNSLEYVYVLSNLRILEQQALETMSQND